MSICTCPSAARYVENNMPARSGCVDSVEEEIHYGLLKLITIDECVQICRRIKISCNIALIELRFDESQCSFQNRANGSPGDADR